MAVSDLVEVKPRQCVDDEPCPDMVFAKVVKNHKIAHHVVVTGKRRRERAAALKTLALLEGCRTRADALVGTDLSDVPCGDHEDFVQALKNMGGDPYQSEGPGLPPRPDPQGWMSPWDLWKGVVNPKENTQDLENEAAVGTDANLNEDNLGAIVADADDDDDNDPDEGLVSAADNKGEGEEEEEGGGMASSQWRTRPEAEVDAELEEEDEVAAEEAEQCAADEEDDEEEEVPTSRSGRPQVPNPKFNSPR